MSFYKNLPKYIKSLPKIYKRSTEQQQRDEMIRLRRELEVIPIPTDIEETRQQTRDLCTALNTLDTIIQLNKDDKGLRKFYWSIRLNLMSHYYGRVFYLSNDLFVNTPKENLYNDVIRKHEEPMSTMHYWRKLTFLLRNPALDPKRLYEHYVRLFKSYGPESARRFYRYVCFIVDHYDKDSKTSILSNLTIHQLKRVILTMDKYYQKEYRFVQKLEKVKVEYIDKETNVSCDAEYREMIFDLSMPRTKVEALKAKAIEKRKAEKKAKQEQAKKAKSKPKSKTQGKETPTKPTKLKKVTPAFLDNYVLKDKPPISKLSLGKAKSVTEVKVVQRKKRTLTQEQIDAMQRDIQSAKETLAK